MTTPLPAYGTQFFTPASSGSGDRVGTFGGTGDEGIFVPQGYTFGTALSATNTFSSKSFASLGLTPGTYTTTWGAGATADFLTINVGAAAAVPEPSTFALLGMGAIGLIGHGRRKRKRAA